MFDYIDEYTYICVQAASYLNDKLLKSLSLSLFFCFYFKFAICIANQIENICKIYWQKKINKIKSIYLIKKKKTS